MLIIETLNIIDVDSLHKREVPSPLKYSYGDV